MSQQLSVAFGARSRGSEPLAGQNLMLDLFTTREIASGIWLAAFLIWALTFSSVRSGSLGVLRSALHWKIVAVFLSLVLYMGGTVLLLREVGFWNPDLAKDTVLWFIVGGMALAFSLIANREGQPLWRPVVADQVKVIVVFEYLVGTYTFPLAWELVLQPILAVVVLMHTVAQTPDERGSDTRILGWIQAIAGLAILGSALLRALSDQPGLEAIRTIALAPLLSLLFIPVFYLLVLGTTYGSLFNVLHTGPAKDWRFRLYARWRLFRRLGLKPRKIAGFQRQFGLRLAGLRTREELNSLLAEADAS